MKTPLAARITGVVAVVGIAAAALSGCSGGSPSDGTTSITVGGLPHTDQPELRSDFLAQIDTFEKENPGISVTPTEDVWMADTFQALLAGGTMPTTIDVPFTEISGLIARKQVADISSEFSSSEVLSTLNPSVVDVVSDGGAVYGVPWNAYTMGLLYNRALFTKAGLDPDTPPATWDEVQADAKIIQDKTGVQGFQSMTKDNTGGWTLAAVSTGFGSSLESEDGTKATVANDSTKQALEFFQTLRWTDNVFGSNFLLDYNDANSAFAAGQVGMFVMGADAYQNVVTNLGMNPDDFGLGPLPQSADGIGTLGGGTAAVVNPKASPGEAAAAVKWIQYHNFEKYTDQALAVSQAKAAAADGAPVGAPTLPVVGQSVQDRYLGWVADYINVPREHFVAYLSTSATVPLHPEPPVKAQEIYATLDTVVQAVLTRQDADIDGLLTEAQKTAQAAIDAG
ncbi:ABC transporter substrate-binding protein [Subtercola endophyticus]|uniref:ABC transporter substrate-binding protein n=1 Tax=Subtercola endophyticus TaxID=2895559 RepID=UPI001E550B7C|nr:extracellular solute-binding protein [Subtercola endophyticus]UFS60840.1 extracellular solute-binding protein [Subtercola endophyticus]